MPIVSYHSTIISNIASTVEATDKTSSQIFLSRGVAGTNSEPESPAVTLTHAPIAFLTIFESQTKHIMSLGVSANSTIIAGHDGKDDSPNKEGEKLSI